MEFYLSAASSITHQPTFKNAGFSDIIVPLAETDELKSPNYKDYIDAGLLRRMSKILRMSVACAKECISQAEIEQPDSIVVGTGLGCLQDTEKFLNTFLTVEGLLPPTSFIQSTHNTIAGQISLSMGNHGYNMTHTQNSLSFEHALLDAMLLLSEDDSNILVGAADEYIEILDAIGAELDLPIHKQLTSGASFFVLSNQQSSQSIAKLIAVEAIGLTNDILSKIEDFLSSNNQKPAAIDLLLFSGIDLEISGRVLTFFEANGVEEDNLVNYLFYSGIYATASAFALNFALDKIRQSTLIKNVLICNYLNKKNLGLMLIQSLEA